MSIRRLAPSLLAFPMLAAYAAGDAAAGKRMFAQCSSCHQIGASARSGFGPQLHGIVGRPAAAAKDYAYSQAMRGSGIVWTEERLHAFLKAPDKVVPGTKMRFWGMSDKDIDVLLAYLRDADRP